MNTEWKQRNSDLFLLQPDQKEKADSLKIPECGGDMETA